jgi:DNA-binding GntR family transcriptional regulator
LQEDVTVDLAQPDDTRAQSRTETTYLGIKEDILKGRLAPESLLLEHELAERFGVSKTPIREALRRLISEGWVLVIPRRGYLVRQLRLQDVREVFGLRQAIECSLFPETLRRATAADLDSLLPWVDSQHQWADDRDRAFVAGSNFHLALAKLSGNVRAEKILGSLLDEVRRLHHTQPSLDSRLSESQELEDHRRIVAALQERDPDLAAEIMRSHLRESLRQMVEVLTEL